MSDLSKFEEGADSSLAEDLATELPPECNVIFYNDDFTTMDFVVKVLVSIFNKSHEDAEFLMRSVHETGSAVLGPYTYDIAISRTKLTVALARKNGFPLRVEVE